MPSPRPYLSRSRLISVWQCPKKLHLEKHHTELAIITSQMESLFASGHQVGDIAQQHYGTDKSIEAERFDPITSALLSVWFILLTAALMPAAHADIHKCTDEYGNVAYLQTPCPAERVEETPVTHDADAHIVEAAEREEMTESSPEPQSSEAQIPSSRQPGELLEVCKKRYRDQIDEIDEEIRSAFTPAQGDVYKERLLALTRQLRACG